MASMGRNRSSRRAHVTRMRLDVIRSEAGRLSGRLVADGGATDVAFEGTLELLRLLEELVDDEPAPASPPALGHVKRGDEAPS
jgi:hypothetical protein